MSRSGWRLVGYLSLISCALVIVAVLYFNWGHGHFWTKYQKIQRGMPKQQVEEILGPPDDEETFGGGTSGTLFCHWHEGRESMSLHFQWDFLNGGYELREKDFRPQTSQDAVDYLIRCMKRLLP
jgi:hypothetical protein